MKKGICLLLVLVLFSILCSSAIAVEVDMYSSENSYELEEKVALMVMSHFNTYYAIKNTYELYNINNDFEAICYELSPCGYIIVNVNDLSVPEFSPTATSPYTSDTAFYVYNGPIRYFEKMNNTYIDLSAQTEVMFTDPTDAYHMTPKSKVDVFEESLRLNAIASSDTEIFTSNRPVKWATNNYCGLDGVSIILRYLYDNHDSRVLDSAWSTNGKLQAFLTNNQYIINAPATTYELAEGVGVYEGLNAFFRGRGLSRVFQARGDRNYSITTLKNSFADDYPALVGFGNGIHPDFPNAHYLIAYGYFSVTGAGTFLVVNDGWGNDDIYTSANAAYYNFGMLLINN